MITKYDTLISQCRDELVRQQLEDKNGIMLSDSALNDAAQKLASEKFERYYKTPLMNSAFPPMSVVKLQNCTFPFDSFTDDIDIRTGIVH